MKDMFFQMFSLELGPTLYRSSLDNAIISMKSPPWSHVFISATISGQLVSKIFEKEIRPREVKY